MSKSALAVLATAVFLTGSGAPGPGPILAYGEGVAGIFTCGSGARFQLQGAGMSGQWTFQLEVMGPAADVLSGCGHADAGVAYVGLWDAAGAACFLSPLGHALCLTPMDTEASRHRIDVCPILTSCWASDTRLSFV